MDLGDILGRAAKGILGAATGGLSDTVIDIVEGVIGGDEQSKLPPEQRANLKIAIEQEVTKREVNAARASIDAERVLNERIAALEGTASDLKALPFVGRLVIFLRGAQRPVWGFGTLYMDYMVFSKRWALTPESYEEIAFWTINVLVLGFLFGERAIKNVLPMVNAFLAARKA